MINTKRPNADDYTQVGFIEAKDTQGNYQNIDHIYDSEGNIVFQQGYLNEYDGANDFRIPAIGKPLIDYAIYGNAFQDGIPTSDDPIMPEGTGERTANLFDKDAIDTNNGYMNSKYIGYDSNIGNSANHNISEYIAIPVGAEHLTISNVSQSTHVYCQFYDSSKNAISIFRYDTIPRTVSIPSNAKYIRCSISKVQMPNFMLNTGSTPLPYEPYGYKIPILSASTTTPVYLGEVETTRKVKKLVLTGEEKWYYENTYSRFFINVADFETLGTRLTPFISNAFGSISDGRPVADVPDNSIYSGAPYKADIHKIFVKCTTYTSLNDWTSYLAAQYAAGTPVTVWYVLATPTTGIVNEPLMRIGDYADSVNFSQAGVEIPTLKRPNTTEIDITTSLPPSEVYAKYRGSKTQKYDLFLAANGDSFEAKNGQSLYIGDDT